MGSKNRSITDAEKAELWTRVSGGGDGSWIMALSRPGVLLRAKNTTTIPENTSAKEYSKQYTDKDWTGTTIKTKDGYYPGTQKHLEERLENGDVDFVDTYYRGIIPFKSFGMIRKNNAPDRHVLRSTIKEIENDGRSVQTYQTYKDTLNRQVVNKLDSLMNAGQFDLIEKDSDLEKGDTGFRIGDSDVYYDAGGYNTVQIVDSDGRIYEKDIDMLDFNPDHWRHKFQFPGSKKALSFLHSQGNPYLITTPWRDVTIKPDFWKWTEENYGVYIGEDGTLINPMGLDLGFLEDEWNNIPGQVYKKGGSIHIKKNNHGKFTESAKRAGMGVQEFARHVLANKDKYSSTLVKRANFARNSKKFKHENGGILKAQEGTGNLLTPHPLSPVGIALNQAKAMAKGKKDQQHLPPGVKEVVGPDGKKVAIRTEQPLVPLEQSIAEWLPGTGDVAEVGYIANDVKNGRYGSAALTAGLTFIPGNWRKVLDSLIPSKKDKFLDFFQKEIGKTVKRVPVTKNDFQGVYSEGFRYLDESGKEIAHIAGSRYGDRVFVESSFMDPEFRSKGIGKQMYFDFNDQMFNKYGKTIGSDSGQHMMTLETSPGVFISPSGRMWRGLRNKGLATTENPPIVSYIMAEPKAIKSYKKYSKGGKL